jgi:hypothetical protein
MLALATHEPHFRVLREDVFFQDTSPGMCRICGQEGHYAAQCTGTKAEIKKEAPKKKPFIFLDVCVLREYLEVELNVSQALFPFNLEQAIDDWVLLIFFVGNDFLPHLPSLEIREGAIDTLLKIWKDELPRMGGYLTNHGQLELSRAEIILLGLAKREDDIFRRRREGAYLKHDPISLVISETLHLNFPFCSFQLRSVKTRMRNVENLICRMETLMAVMVMAAVKSDHPPLYSSRLCHRRRSRSPPLHTHPCLHAQILQHELIRLV